MNNKDFLLKYGSSEHLSKMINDPATSPYHLATIANKRVNDIDDDGMTSLIHKDYAMINRNLAMHKGLKSHHIDQLIDSDISLRYSLANLPNFTQAHKDKIESKLK